MPNGLLEDVAAGTPEAVRRQVERFEAIDAVDATRIGFFSAMDGEERRRTLDALAP